MHDKSEGWHLAFLDLTGKVSSPEDQKLFQSRLHTRQVETATNKNLTPTEKAEQFRQWVAQFPKSNVSLLAEASLREDIYSDRETGI